MSKEDDPHHHPIGGALRALVARGVRLCCTSQTLGEFWNASTRPLDKNGFGLSVSQTDRLARVIERDLEFLTDSQAVHDRWRGLLVEPKSKAYRSTMRDSRPACMYTAFRSC